MGTLSGIHIRQYQILERLRFDYAFAVYNAYDPQADERVWCWFVFPETIPTETFARKFLEQMQALSALEHRNLIPIREFGREQNLLFWITPVMAGGQLSTRITESRKPKETAALAWQIAVGLEYLHKQGLIHGCLSPDTVFFDENQQARLGLYSLSGIVNAEIDRSVPDGMVGFGLGRPGYLSPEQINRREANGQSDLYALGAITFTLLTGEEPFNAATPTETTFKQVTAPLAWPKKLPRGISQTTIRFVHKCLARHPEERFESAGEARRILSRIAQGKGARIRLHKAQLAGAPKPAYLPALRLFLVLAILVVGGGAAAWRYWVFPAMMLSSLSSKISLMMAPTPAGDIQPTAVLAENTRQSSAALTPASAMTGESTPTPVEQTPNQQAVEATAAASTAEPTASLPQPSGGGPVLFGTQTPGEAQMIRIENIQQIDEVARLGFGKFIQVAWSPDETTLALASTAGVFVFNFGGLVAFIDAGAEADSVAFSLDGATLAIGLYTGDIQLWDWQAREMKATIPKAHNERVSRLLFSPNRRFLISASYDQYIKVWNVDSRELVHDIPAHKLPVYDIAITGDSRKLVSGGGDQLLKVWDIATGNKLDEFAYPDRVQAVAITEDGTYVAAGGQVGLIYQWSLKTRQLRTDPLPTRSRIWSLYYNGDKVLIAGLDDGKTRQIDATMRPSMMDRYYTISPIPNEMWEKYGSGFEFSSFTAVSGSGQATASVNWDGTFALNGSRPFTLPTMYDSFTRLAFSPDSRYLLAGGVQNQVFLLRTGENLLVGQVNNMSILNGDPFSENSEMIALASPVVTTSRRKGENEMRVNQARIFLSNGMQLSSSLSEIPENGAMQFTHGDSLLVAANASASRLWDLKTGSEAFVSTAYEQGCEVSRSTNDREQIFSIYTTIGLMREWDERAKQICGLSSGFGQRPEIFSMDRKWLASVNPYGGLEMLDVSTGKVTWQQKPDHEVANMAFSPDNTLLVTGSEDGTLSFWDTTNGRIVRIINAHFGPVQAIAFSPDGKRVASGSIDGTVRIWEATQGAN